MRDGTTVVEAPREIQQREDGVQPVEQIAPTRNTVSAESVEGRAKALRNRENEDAIEMKRVHLIIPEIAYREALAGAKKKGWTLTQFVLYAVGFFVDITERMAKGERFVVRTSEGERELVLPRY